MSSRRRAGPWDRASSILIFGEDENDTRSIREVVLAAVPTFAGAVKPLRRPPVFSKGANPESVRSHVSGMCDVIRAEMATSSVVCVLVHRDCDAVTPAHVGDAKEIETAFRAEGFDVTAVTPAWEMEAWLFLWPTAVSAYRSHWKLSQRYMGRNTGLIRNAKEEFRRAVRNNRYRDYRESDAPGIFAKVRELQVLDKPEGTNASFSDFRTALSALP